MRPRTARQVRLADIVGRPRPFGVADQPPQQQGRCRRCTFLGDELRRNSGTETTTSRSVSGSSTTCQHQRPGIRADAPGPSPSTSTAVPTTTCRRRPAPPRRTTTRATDSSFTRFGIQYHRAGAAVGGGSGLSGPAGSVPFDHIVDPEEFVEERSISRRSRPRTPSADHRPDVLSLSMPRTDQHARPGHHAHRHPDGTLRRSRVHLQKIQAADRAGTRPGRAAFRARPRRVSRPACARYIHGHEAAARLEQYTRGTRRHAGGAPDPASPRTLARIGVLRSARPPVDIRPARLESIWRRLPGGGAGTLLRPAHRHAGRVRADVDGRDHLRELSLIGTAINDPGLQAPDRARSSPGCGGRRAPPRLTGSVIHVLGRLRASSSRCRYASSSASAGRPAGSGHGGGVRSSRVPTVSAMVMMRFADARATSTRSSPSRTSPSTSSCNFLSEILQVPLSNLGNAGTRERYACPSAEHRDADGTAPRCCPRGPTLQHQQEPQRPWSTVRSATSDRSARCSEEDGRRPGRGPAGLQRDRYGAAGGCSSAPWRAPAHPRQRQGTLPRLPSVSQVAAEPLQTSHSERYCPADHAHQTGPRSRSPHQPQQQPSSPCPGEQWT